MSWLRRCNEQGIAVITVMMMMAIVAALGATVTVVSINNMSNSSADRQAGAALGISEAGVAQAISYLNNNGVGKLATTCVTANSYCNPSSPKVISSLRPAMPSAGLNRSCRPNGRSGAPCGITVIRERSTQ